MIKSNVPISTPTLFPDKEVITSNGFAWTNEYGIVLQSSTYTTTTNGDGSQWLGTQAS